MIKHDSRYETDFAAWAIEQAEAIRQGRFKDIDLENVAEEIESLARSDRREIRNRLVVLYEHLYKLQSYPTENAVGGWKNTVLEQRDQISDLLEESPSLVPMVEDEMFLAQLRHRAWQKFNREYVSGHSENSLPTSVRALIDMMAVFEALP